MKKIILTAILAGSAAFAFAGDFSLNLGGIGISVGEGRHGTNVGISVGSPYCYPAVTVPAHAAESPPDRVSRDRDAEKALLRSGYGRNRTRIGCFLT